MADARTRRQKLEAMARQTASPNEAAIARAKLREIPERPRPASTRPSADAAATMDAFRRAATDSVRTTGLTAEALRRFMDAWGAWGETPPRYRTRRQRAEEEHPFVEGIAQRCIDCGLGRYVGLHPPDA